jgi:hypothetical protein
MSEKKQIELVDFLRDPNLDCEYNEELDVACVKRLNNLASDNGPRTSYVVRHLLNIIVELLDIPAIL